MRNLFLNWIKIWVMFENQTEPTKTNQQVETLDFIRQQWLYGFDQWLWVGLSLFFYKQVRHFVNFGEDIRYAVLLSPHITVLGVPVPEPAPPPAPTKGKSISNHLLRNTAPFCSHIIFDYQSTINPQASQQLCCLPQKLWVVLIKFYVWEIWTVKLNQVSNSIWKGAKRMLPEQSELHMFTERTKGAGRQSWGPGKPSSREAGTQRYRASGQDSSSAAGSRPCTCKCFCSDTGVVL